MSPSKKNPIVEIDVDEAYSVSAGEDGVIDTVYFDIAEQDGKWWLSAMIDCDSASFVDSLVKDDGPYDSENDALMGGLNAAVDWMVNNDYGDYEVDSRLQHLCASGGATEEDGLRP